MTQSGFATGAPCWFDVTSPDIPATAAFYSELFGWKADDLGPEAGHYTILSQDGAPVAGIAPATAPDGSTAPPMWTTYFAVPDAETTVRAAREAGAQVYLEPTDVFGQLTFAVLGDPAGAMYAVAQLVTHPGTARWAEVNNPCWVEYAATGAPADAMAHYARVLGWRHQTAAWETDTVAPYQALAPGAGGREFGGAHAATEGEPAPSWSVTLRVEDCDALAERAVALGGSVVTAAADMPGPSRVGALADPAGATFATMSFG
ncbi:VOC family protein [Nocardia farcinica]|uniref:VOC family protein n=1 Tax=Nocardia farcinica TaxID=37329 RepID=UPI0018949660|nr:VOC family protein [Nocardia farcinica]MBF6140985.1 VOC family protein [Nocardia farcinica]MBF6359261.1 VOC family protein [Nocardia farcinica]MBF6384373.1 VOC family protein [Nocardia farcinica]